MKIEQILQFRFNDPVTQANFQHLAPSMYKAMMEEMRPIVTEELADNEATCKERLRKYNEFLNRLAYLRNEAETFYQIAYSQQLVARSLETDLNGKPLSPSVAKEIALQDCAGVNYLSALARWLWESIRQGKSSVQSLLKAERESRWAGGGPQ